MSRSRSDFVSRLAWPRIEFFPENHSYLVNGALVPSVTQLVGEVPVGVDWDTLEAAGERGTAIHLLTEQVDRGEVPDPVLAEKYRGRLDQWLRARQFLHGKLELIECMVASLRYRYAGRVDRVFSQRCGDGVDLALVVDIKTGGHASWHFDQVALYMEALLEAGAQRVSGALVYLRPDPAVEPMILSVDPGCIPRALARIIRKRGV